MKIGLDALKEVVRDMQTSVNVDQRVIVPVVITMLTAGLELKKAEEDILRETAALVKFFPDIHEKLPKWLEMFAHTADQKPLIENDEKYNLFLYDVIPIPIVELLIGRAQQSLEVLQWVGRSLPFPADWDTLMQLTQPFAKSLVDAGMVRIRTSVAKTNPEAASELDQDYIQQLANEFLATTLFYYKMRVLMDIYSNRIAELKLND